MFHRTILAALLVAGAALAEERFGVKGQFVPSGSISYTHLSVGNTSSHQVNLSPGLLWFPISAVAVGGSVSYQHVSGLFGGSINSFAFGRLHRTGGTATLLGLTSEIGGYF